MRSVFALVEAQALLLTLLIFVGLGPVPQQHVQAFPTGTTPYIGSNSETTATVSPSPSNESLLISVGTDDTTSTGELTEYPVFISVPEDETPTVSPAILSDSFSSSSVILADGEEESDQDAVTEGYMVIDEQEMDDDDDDDDGSDSSTVSSAIVRTTLPMRSPKSSREQEEVLRELKKLWDLSEGLSDSVNDTGLKNSLSSIIYLAYARVYSESDETLLKLKYLLQKLQERILGTETNAESFPTTSTPSSRSSTTPYEVLTSEPNYASSASGNEGSSPTNLVTGKRMSNHETGSQHDRKRRSYYEDVESIFFANVDSEENSVIPDEKNYYKLNQNQSSDDNDISHMNGEKKYGNVADNMSGLTSQLKNGSDGVKGDPLDRTLLQVGAISSSTSSSTTVLSVSTLKPVVVTTPSTMVQKIIHINDRRKTMPSFYLSPERIQELKERMKSTTPLPPPPPTTPKSTSTLSPISIAIQDEVENEVNSLQQQGQVDNYDVHISENFPSVSTTASPPNEKKRPGLTTISSLSLSTGSPYSAEEIALALFQLLRPDALDDNNEIENNEQVKVTMQPRPTPPNILYQVGALSSRLNFTISKPSSESTVTSAPVTVTSQSTTSSTTTRTTSLSPSTSTTTTKPPSTIPPSVLSVLKLKDILKRNSTLLDIPSELSNLGLALTTTSRSTTSTERQNVYQNNDVYDDYDDPMPTPSPTLIDGIRDTILQTIAALTRLSIGAKIVLLFSICISFISIGFGLYAVGPPLAGVGLLGVIIPVALLLLFETAAMPQMSTGNRKLELRRRQEQLIEKVQSDEFSHILDMIFDAVMKYGKGERKMWI